MSESVWGTISGTSPLRVTIDGDAAELPFTPESVVNPTLFEVGDRVRCEFSSRRLLILGVGGGMALATTTKPGPVELATSAESIAGSSTTVVNTPAGAKAAFDDWKTALGSRVATTHVTDRTFTTSSTSMVDITGMSVSITPRSTSAKILILVSMMVGATSMGLFQLLRGATVLSTGADGTFIEYVTTGGADGVANVNWHYIDEPNTTSAVTYKVQGKVNSGSMRLNRRVNSDLWQSTSNITVVEIA